MENKINQDVGGTPKPSVQGTAGDNLKRPIAVGETTGGGAHPVSGHRIDDHCVIGVPFARAINPISRANWEGTGVELDVKVPAAEELATAQKLAIEKLGSK
jgi:retinol-binding protein 3